MALTESQLRAKVRQIAIDAYDRAAQENRLHKRAVSRDEVVLGVVLVSASRIWRIADASQRETAAGELLDWAARTRSG